MGTPDGVFKIWLDGNDRRGPWVGDGYRKLEPRVGGKFRWDDRNWYDQGGDGGHWPHYGKFLTIDDSKLPYVIEYSWQGKEWTDDNDCLVRVEISKKDEQFSNVSLTMSKLPDNYHGYEHKPAWVRILHEMHAKCWNNTGEKDRLATGVDLSKVEY